MHCDIHDIWDKERNHYNILLCQNIFCGLDQYYFLQCGLCSSEMAPSLWLQGLTSSSLTNLIVCGPISIWILNQMDQLFFN